MIHFLLEIVASIAEHRYVAIAYMYFGAIVALTILGVAFQRRFRKRKSKYEDDVLDNDTLRNSILTPLGDTRYRLGDDDDDDGDEYYEHNERNII